MAKETIEKPKMNITSFCNISINNPREAFHAQKKFKGQELAYDEWVDICVKEGLEVKTIK